MIKEVKKKDPKYMAAYYQKNKERLKEYQREQYSKDPSMKDKSLERQKKRRERLRGEREAEAERLGITLSRKKPMGAREFEVTLESGAAVLVFMHTIGDLAQHIGRTPVTLRSWERRGILPEPIYRDNFKRRLYTSEQMAAISAVIKEADKEGITRWTKSDVPAKLHAIWEDMPNGVRE